MNLSNLNCPRSALNEHYQYNNSMFQFMQEIKSLDNRTKTDSYVSEDCCYRTNNRNNYSNNRVFNTPNSFLKENNNFDINVNIDLLSRKDKSSSDNKSIFNQMLKNSLTHRVKKLKTTIGNKFSKSFFKLNNNKKESIKLFPSFNSIRQENDNNNNNSRNDKIFKNSVLPRFLKLKLKRKNSFKDKKAKYIENSSLNSFSTNSFKLRHPKGNKSSNKSLYLQEKEEEKKLLHKNPGKENILDFISDTISKFEQKEVKIDSTNFVEWKDKSNSSLYYNNKKSREKNDHEDYFNTSSMDYHPIKNLNDDSISAFCKKAKKIFYSDEFNKKSYFSNNNQEKKSLLDYSIHGYLAIAVKDKIYFYIENSPSGESGKLYLIYSFSNCNQSNTLVDVTKAINNESNIDLDKLYHNSFNESYSSINNNQQKEIDTNVIINHIKFTPNGERLIISLSNGTIAIYDIVNFKLINTISNEISFSCDGKQPNSSEKINIIKDVSINKCNNNVFSVIGNVNLTIFNKNTDLEKESLRRDRIINFDLRCKTPVSSLTPTSSNPNNKEKLGLNTLKWSNDGSQLAIGSSQGSIIIYDSRIISNKIVLESDSTNQIQCLAWSNTEANKLITSESPKIKEKCKEESEVKIWDTKEYKQLKSIKSNSYINDLQIVETNKNSSNKNSSYQNPKSFNEINVICCYESSNSANCLPSNNNYQENKSKTNGIFSWNCDKEEVDETFNIENKTYFRNNYNPSGESENSIISMTTSNCGKSLACICAGDKTLRIWSLNNNEISNISNKNNISASNYRNISNNSYTLAQKIGFDNDIEMII